MKILVLWDYYNSYFSYFYGNHPGTQLLSYTDQLKKLKNDYFYWPPYLVDWFNELGNKSELIIGNCEPLQQQWARENGLSYNENDWHIKIVIKQIEKYKPDILFLGGYTDIYFGSFIKDIRKYCRLIVAWKAASISTVLGWSNIDLVLSSHINFVNQFRKMDICSERILPCFEPKILDLLAMRVPTIDISFVGTLSTTYFSRRMKLLGMLTKEFPIRIFAEKPEFRRRPFPLLKYVKQFSLIAFTFNNKLDRPVYGLNMFRILRESKIVINIHVDSAQGLAGNIRMFEATGVGALLITEAAPNIHELFIPGKEIVTYGNAEELIEKVRYYKFHDNESEEIAQAGQKRTLRDHNSRSRALEMITIFKKYLH